MIEAKTHGLRAWAWGRYILWRLRRDFHGVWVRGSLPDSDEPLIVYANHPSWWDGFSLYALCRAAKRPAICMMEERQLRQYPFLAHLGAFSIRRGEARSAAESLGYARRWLEQPRSVVALFPEGVLRPHATPPLALERGVEVLARRAQARCVPVALRYAFFGAERPELLIDVGQAHTAGSIDQFAAALDAVVHAAQRTTSLDGYVSLGDSGKFMASLQFAK